MVEYWKNCIIPNHLPPIGNKKRLEMAELKKATKKNYNQVSNKYDLLGENALADGNPNFTNIHLKDFRAY